MTRYQVLLVAEIDCEEPDGSDLQAKLDAFRECVSYMDREHWIALFRATPDDVNNLDFGVNGLFVAAHLAPDQPKKEK